jgi:hypothetical protein
MTYAIPRLIPSLLVTAAILGGCGTANRPVERTAGGAAVGAAGGAAVGALFGGVGAVPGAVTNESQVDLGEPVWRRDFGGPQA